LKSDKVVEDDPKDDDLDIEASVDRELSALRTQRQPAAQSLITPVFLDVNCGRFVPFLLSPDANGIPLNLVSRP
jgi:hypothetical protein